MLLVLLTSLFLTSSLNGMVVSSDCFCEKKKEYFDKQLAKYFTHDDFSHFPQDTGLIGAAKLLEQDGYEKIRNNPQIIQLAEKTIGSLLESNYFESAEKEKKSILCKVLRANQYGFDLPFKASHEDWIRVNKDTPSVQCKDSLASFILVKVYLKSTKIRD